MDFSPIHNFGLTAIGATLVEARVRKDHPLRAIRAMVDEVLSQLSATVRHDVRRCWPAVDCAGETVAGAVAADAVHDPQRMEEMDYNLSFRWFVGLNADEEVWDATTFTKNRDRLLEADVTKEFLALGAARCWDSRVLNVGQRRIYREHGVARPLNEAGPHLSDENKWCVLQVAHLKQLPDHHCFQDRADSSRRDHEGVRGEHELV